MSKIFKIFLFCCSSSEESKEEVESENKNMEQRKTADKASVKKEEMIVHKSQSEENREVNKVVESSESCSISSGND